MPLFEVNAHHARLQAGAEAIAMLPFVSREDRTAWESYSQDNQWWIEESRGLDLDKEGEEGIQSSSYLNSPILPFVFEFDSVGRPIPANETREVRSRTGNRLVFCMHGDTSDEVLCCVSLQR
jgi:hypothetical protein